jgi:hypothetical protein
MKKLTITEKRLSVEEQIKALKNKKRQLEKQEKAEADKERVSRQTNRGMLIEKIIPSLISLSDSEFETYMKKILSPPSTKGGILMESEVADDEE